MTRGLTWLGGSGGWSTRIEALTLLEAAPAWRVTSWPAPSPGPAGVSQPALAFIEDARSGGLLTAAKHFPARIPLNGFR